MERLVRLRSLEILLLVLVAATPILYSRAQAAAEDASKWSCDDESLNKLALQSLHEKLDDDHDGEVELNETSEFVLHEFSGTPHNGRYKKFHANDSNIDLAEMTTRWTDVNPAYNWSTAEVVYWLEEAVRLPAYSATFVQYKIVGKCLPRIALNKEKFLQEVLGVFNREERSRLKLKAMEVVLFGPIFPSHFWYHVGLALTSIMAIVLGFYVLLARKRNNEMARMLEETRIHLQEAQTIKDALSNNQREEPSAVLDEVSMTTTNSAESTAPSIASSLDADSSQDDISLHTENFESQIAGLKQHIVFLKRQLESQPGSGPAIPMDLLKLLCQTYERETGYFDASKVSAEKRLQESEEAYSKFVKKVKNSILPGSMRVSGGRSLVELDQCINDARSKLSAVVADRQERRSRWTQIEKICHFKVTEPQALRKLSQAKPAVPVVQRAAGEHRLSRKGPKASTFSGSATPTEWEVTPGCVQRSISSQDPHRLTKQPSTATFHTASSHTRSLSPSSHTTSLAAIPMPLPTSASAHSLQRMPEVDESDQSPSPQRRRKDQSGGDEAGRRRRSDEVTVRRHVTKSSSATSASFTAPLTKSSRQKSDPGSGKSTPVKLPATAGGSNHIIEDASAPESEV